MPYNEIKRMKNVYIDRLPYICDAGSILPQSPTLCYIAFHGHVWIFDICVCVCCVCPTEMFPPVPFASLLTICIWWIVTRYLRSICLNFVFNTMTMEWYFWIRYIQAVITNSAYRIHQSYYQHSHQSSRTP